MKPTTASGLYQVVLAMTQTIDRDLPITSALVYLRVAAAGDEGVDQGRVQDELEMSTASISRTVQTLGDVHYTKGKPGLGIVSREFDPTDNRRRVLRLTTKGRQLMRDLNRAGGWT